MANRSFKCVVEKELGKFPYFVIYALLEWMLIIMLFIDGFIAFAANEFAKFFELQIPCLLCTRIDHVFVERNPDFYYNDSICESHQKKVSNLAYCHVHKKLSEIRKMCEGCLLSFATEKESDCDTYKSLVGILHKDLELLVYDDQEIQLAFPAGKKEDSVLPVEKNSLQRCSCCGVPLKVRSTSQLKGKNSDILSLAPAPSPRASFASPRASFSSPRASFASFRNEENRNLDLAYIRCTKLKYSDTESELPEDDDGSNAMNRDKQLREGIKAATMPLLTDPDDMNEDKTPNFARGGNKFFGIPLSDSAQNSPRWTPRFPKKSLLERTENASDSMEGNGTNEADGDSILHHLKRQVRLDRTSLMALYMELDEERSASAVAANNAMAMITRLQAEKAAVQMEALQYQRLMEEQAEYDQEALQATKDLLTKREEEIKELEAELEDYRGKYGCLMEDEYEGQGDVTDQDYQDLKFQSHSSYNTGKVEHNGLNHGSSEGSNTGENEHNHDGARSSHDENGGRTPDKSPKGEKTHLSPKKILDKKLQISSDNGAISSQSSTENVNNVEEETGQWEKHILTKELSDIHERVKALEADDGCLKHVSQTLPDGNEGATVLTDISSNLNKLRNFVMMPFSENNKA